MAQDNYPLCIKVCFYSWGTVFPLEVPSRSITLEALGKIIEEKVHFPQKGLKYFLRGKYWSSSHTLEELGLFSEDTLQLIPNSTEVSSEPPMEQVNNNISGEISIETQLCRKLQSVLSLLKDITSKQDYASICSTMNHLSEFEFFLDTKDEESNNFVNEWKNLESLDIWKNVSTFYQALKKCEQWTLQPPEASSGRNASTAGTLSEKISPIVSFFKAFYEVSKTLYDLTLISSEQSDKSEERKEILWKVGNSLIKLLFGVLLICKIFTHTLQAFVDYSFSTGPLTLPPFVVSPNSSEMLSASVDDEGSGNTFGENIEYMSVSSAEPSSAALQATLPSTSFHKPRENFDASINHQEGAAVEELLNDSSLSLPADIPFSLSDMGVPPLVEKRFNNWVGNPVVFSRNVLQNAQIKPFSYSYASGAPDATDNMTGKSPAPSIFSFFKNSWRSALIRMDVTEEVQIPTDLENFYLSYFLKDAALMAAANPDYIEEKERFPCITEVLKLLEEIQHK